MKCEFCQRKGHTIHFCPSLPTRPDIADRDEYIEKLMHSPRHQALDYEGLSWEQAWERADTLGQELNIGNPWMIKQRNPIFVVSWVGGKL